MFNKTYASLWIIPVRFMGGRGFVSNENRNPMFSKLRHKKFIKVDLPDFDGERKERKKNKDIPMEEIRAKLKKAGIPLFRPWRERPIHSISSGEVMDEYVPPGGERVGWIGRRAIDSVKDTTLDKYKNIRSRQAIRKYLHEWNWKTFPDEALTILKSANQALMDRNEDELHKHVTELVFPALWNETKRKSVRWEWVEALEPGRVVHVRSASLIRADDVFGQVTVRFHSRQKLAIYDQFGRLMLGDPDIAQDVLEYLVFEIQLSNLHGTWRLHHRILPIDARAAGFMKTFRYVEPVKKPTSKSTQSSDSTQQDNIDPEKAQLQLLS